MADYTWSPIVTEDGIVDVGESVTASKLGVSEDEFQSMKDAGAVRSRKYPKDTKPNESVRERNLRVFAERVREASEGDYDIPLGDEDENETPSAAEAKEVTKPK